MADLGRAEERSNLQIAPATLSYFRFQRPKKHSYHDITNSESEKLTDADELEDPHRPRRQYFNVNIWFFTTILLLTFSVAQNRNVFRSYSRASGSYETGFSTDLPAPQRTIHVERHRFTAALRDHSNGSLYMFSDASKPQYVGLPNPAVDANWDALTHGRYFALTTPESSMLHRDTQAAGTIRFALYGSDQHPSIFAGPDVLHSLHCLNAVRKHLDHEYYVAHMELPAEYRRMHIDHCIDQLRQSIMCHADLPPVTLKPV
ncbi:hypothetical protein N0V91_008012 [Didymella pomorum]|uniref:Uncharacterized protein n=1 Tax=Didymella pomorum TaxID=749634 RepID=A0A9W8Z7M0_9PLEO|nr:hypothetical protein N0V91_008012 [Didymella pomorum]